MKVSGYCFDPETLKSKVKGYKELSFKARHALRDILDLIWSSEQLSLPDDEVLVSYIGFTKREWVPVRNEIITLPRKFVSLSGGLWTSPWLEKQKSNLGDIINNNPQFVESFDIIGNSDMEDEDSLENLRSELDINPDLLKQLGERGLLRDPVKGGSRLFKSPNKAIGVNTRAKNINDRLLKRYKVLDGEE